MRPPPDLKYRFLPRLFSLCLLPAGASALPPRGWGGPVLGGNKDTASVRLSPGGRQGNFCTGRTALSLPALPHRGSPRPAGLWPLSRPPFLTSLFSILSFPSTVCLGLHSSVPLIGHLPPLLSDWPASLHHPICLPDSPCLPTVMDVDGIYPSHSRVRPQTLLSLCLLSLLVLVLLLPRSVCLLAPPTPVCPAASLLALLSASLSLIPRPPASLSVCPSLRLLSGPARLPVPGRSSPHRPVSTWTPLPALCPPSVLEKLKLQYKIKMPYDPQLEEDGFCFY